MKKQEIDDSLGLINCGNDRMLYVMTLKSMLEHVPSRLEHMEKTLSDGDLTAYSIEAHTLKSNALLIGAKLIHQEAKELEYGAKENNEEMLHKKTSEFIEHYKEMLEEIKQLLMSKFQENMLGNKEISEEDRAECRNIVEETYFLLTQKKHSLAMDCFEVLTVYDLPKEYETIVQDIIKAFQSGKDEYGMIQFMRFREEL